MRMSLAAVSALTLGGLLFHATTAHAQSGRFITEDAGFYWWLDAGAAIPEDNHLTEYGGLPSGQGVEYDVGGGLNVAAGYAFNRYFATELQFGGTWNSVSSIEGARIRDTYFATAPILVNAVLQCPLPRTRLIPYLGVGAGGAATVFDTDDLFQPLPEGAVNLYGADSDFVFAWQAFAGIRLELSDQISLGLSYRYLQVDDSAFRYESGVIGEPDFILGLSSHQSHLAAIIFHMKF